LNLSRNTFLILGFEVYRKREREENKQGQFGFLIENT